MSWLQAIPLKRKSPSYSVSYVTIKLEVQ